MYNKANTCVINNGFFSEFFELKRGCRQGDPLSPYIFILAIEPLAMEIKGNKAIKGITINNIIYKIGQYADDTFLILDGSVNSLEQSMKIFNDFYLCSGLKLNYEKTVAVWLGTMKNSTNILCPEINMTWSNKFNLLGITFCTDLRQMVSENYNSKIQSIKSILNSYKKRNISILGKVTVLKTIIVPKLIYLLKVLPSPSLEFFAEMESCFKNFIWEEKKPKIIMAQLEKDIEQGGLRLPNLRMLDKALKLTWTAKLLKDQGLWQNLFESSTTTNKKNIWMLDQLSLQNIKLHTNNLFWKDVLSAWKMYREILNEKIDVRTFPIWDTFFLQNKNVNTRKPKLEEKGLLYVNDLLLDSGELMGFQDFQGIYQSNVNFVDFYSLIHSIPRKWKNEINQQKYKIIGQITQKGLEEILSMKRVCNEIYWKLMDTIKPKRNYLSKWTEYFQTPITEQEMRNFFSLNFQCTRENKLRSFQYKILQRCLTTNKFLNICKISDDKCYFCNKEVETLEHLFWDCTEVKKLWLSVIDTLEPYINLREVIDNKSVLLGINSGENKSLTNHIINIIKRYIYVIKYSEKQLSYHGALAKVREAFNIEQNIRIQYNKECSSLHGKWDPVKITFPDFEMVICHRDLT